MGDRFGDIISGRHICHLAGQRSDSTGRPAWCAHGTSIRIAVARRAPWLPRNLIAIGLAAVVDQRAIHRHHSHVPCRAADGRRRDRPTSLIKHHNRDVMGSAINEYSLSIARGVGLIGWVFMDVSVQIRVRIIPHRVGLEEPVPLARDRREGRIFSIVF